MSLIIEKVSIIIKLGKFPQLVTLVCAFISALLLVFYALKFFIFTLRLFKANNNFLEEGFKSLDKVRRKKFLKLWTYFALSLLALAFFIFLSFVLN